MVVFALLVDRLVRRRPVATRRELLTWRRSERRMHGESPPHPLLDGSI
jgi:hypothetical protein